MRSRISHTIGENMIFKQISIDLAKKQLPALKASIQLEKMGVVVTQKGQVCGFIVPLSVVDGIADENETSLIQKTKVLSWSNFCSWTNCEIVKPDIDCTYITFHGRRILAFVNPKFQSHIPLPIIGNSGIGF